MANKGYYIIRVMIIWKMKILSSYLINGLIKFVPTWLMGYLSFVDLTFDIWHLIESLLHQAREWMKYVDLFLSFYSN